MHQLGGFVCVIVVPGGEGGAIIDGWSWAKPILVLPGGSSLTNLIFMVIFLKEFIIPVDSTSSRLHRMRTEIFLSKICRRLIFYSCGV